MNPRGLKSLSLLLALCFLCLFIARINANSEPVQWEVNGHWYDVIDFSSTWFKAFLDARSRSYQDLPGHLATLTSQVESDFVIQTFQPANRWLGGFQFFKARKVDRGWRWITRERWRFTDWYPGEPNDCCIPGEDGEENFLHFRSIELKWNDWAGRQVASGYIIEYEEMPEQSLAPIMPEDIHQRKLTSTWADLKQAR